jgi:hypothetical protein
MNLDELERKLMAAARCNPPDDRVPHAFEKRIMARLKSCIPLDDWALWARALWRAAGTCAAVALLLGAISLLTPKTNTANSSNDLSQAFESTLLASVGQDADYSQ